MRARFDIIDPTIGRVILSSLFNAPPHGIKGPQVQKILRKLRGFKADLERDYGEGNVALSLDSYEGSVFWYLVLFRPVAFIPDHAVFGNRKVNVYDILRTRGGARDVAMSNLGLQYDPEHNWLVLYWDEAMKGVLEGIEQCPSWEAILAGCQRRTKAEPTRDFWRSCAESYSWVVPVPALANMCFLKDRRHDKNTYDNISVLNLEGIEMLHVEGRGKGVGNDARLMVAKTIHFVHHYVHEDIREYKHALAIKRECTKERDMEKNRAARKKYMKSWREDQKRKKYAVAAAADFEEKHAPLWIVTRAVYSIMKSLKVGVSRGRMPAVLEADKCERFYQQAIGRLLAQQVFIAKGRWDHISEQLQIIEAQLKFHPEVPPAFGLWLGLRDPRYRKEEKEEVLL